MQAASARAVRKQHEQRICCAAQSIMISGQLAVLHCAVQQSRSWQAHRSAT